VVAYLGVCQQTHALYPHYSASNQGVCLFGGLPTDPCTVSTLFGFLSKGVCLFRGLHFTVLLFFVSSLLCHLTSFSSPHLAGSLHSSISLLYLSSPFLFLSLSLSIYLSIYLSLSLSSISLFYFSLSLSHRIHSPLTRSLSLLLTHPLTHSLAHSPTHSLTHLLTRSLALTCATAEQVGALKRVYEVDEVCRLFPFTKTGKQGSLCDRTHST
jgi:hypothetical protein